LIPSDIARIQPRAWKLLSRAVENDRVAGTYLFYGPPKVGHWPLAVSFAALLNCETRPRPATDEGLPIPCGECFACRNIFGLNFEGFLVALPLAPHKKADEGIDLANAILEEKREEPFRPIRWSGNDMIRIETAREVRRQLSTRAPGGMTRVALFHHMEKMRLQSADALLKMIEEPPSDTVIILTTERPESLLPTIQSRSQMIRLERSDPAIVASYLESNLEVEPDKAAHLARLAEGSLGAAVELAAQREDDDSSRRAVGHLLFKSLFLDSKAETVSLAATMVNQRDRAQFVELLNLWQSLIADCSRYSISGDEAGIINSDFQADIVKLSSRFNGSHPARSMSSAIKIALDDMALNVHILGSLSALVLRLKSAIEAEPAL